MLEYFGFSPLHTNYYLSDKSLRRKKKKIKKYSDNQKSSKYRYPYENMLNTNIPSCLLFKLRYHTIKYARLGLYIFYVNMYSGEHQK